MAPTHTYSERGAVDPVDSTLNSPPQVVYRDTLYFMAGTDPAQNPVLDPYMTQDGDSFMILSARYLADPQKWWYVADMNPQIRYPFDLKVGDELGIPE